MKALELRVPPVLVLVLCALLVHFTAKWHLLLFSRPEQLSLPVISLTLVGLAVIFAGVWSFRTAQTTVDPTHPERASSLVTAGIYQYTRNPMYLGFGCLLLAYIAYCGSLVGMVWLLVMVAYLTRFQIIPEEQAMQERFGEEYQAYTKVVRRWL